MSITLELEPEQEELLCDLAARRGLTAEGYLLTLIETLLAEDQRRRQEPPSLLSRLGRKKESAEQAPDAQVRARLREMRESLFTYREQAVEAVTKANMLRSALEQQERRIAEKELKVIRLYCCGDRERAGLLYRETTILKEHLPFVRNLLETAAEEATQKVEVFQQEEAKTQRHAEDRQEARLKVYRQAFLNEEQMQKRIAALHTEEEWGQAFTAWVESLSLPEEPLPPRDPMTPQKEREILAHVQVQVGGWAKYVQEDTEQIEKELEALERALKKRKTDGKG